MRHVIPPNFSRDAANFSRDAATATIMHSPCHRGQGFELCPLAGAGKQTSVIHRPLRVMHMLHPHSHVYNVGGMRQRGQSIKHA